MSGLDYRDMVDAVEEGVRKAMEAVEEDRPPAAAMPIKEFAAVDENGRDVRVVAMTWHEGVMQFVCIVSDPDDAGGMYPVILETVYPPGTPARAVEEDPEPLKRTGITGVTGFSIPGSLDEIVEINRQRAAA